MSATRTTILAALVLLLTFGAGLVGGAAAHHVLAMRRPGPPPELVPRAMIRQLDRRLDLTDAQRTQIEAIVMRRHQRMRAEIETTNDEIAKVLTPEQRVKFAQIRLRMHRPHGRHFR